MKLLILSCPRSATTYTSKLFQKNGFMINHEEIGDDGIVSWPIVSYDNTKVWGPSYTEVIDHYNDNVLFYHQVRNPFKVIPSMLSLRKESFDFVEKNTYVNHSDNIIVRCMKFWYYWNLRCEEKTDRRYKVEDIEETFKFKNQIEKDTINSRNHLILMAKDLWKEDKDLFHKILEKSFEYGYEI
jgi:hypothetical protein